MTEDETIQKMMTLVNSYGAQTMKLVIRDTEYDIETAMREKRADIASAFNNYVRFNEPVNLETNDEIFFWLDLREMGLMSRTVMPETSMGSPNINWRAANRNIKTYDRIHYLFDMIKDTYFELEP